MVATLPQLSDQLESYAIVKRKTTFAMSELIASLTRAPMRGASLLAVQWLGAAGRVGAKRLTGDTAMTMSAGKVEEQIHLLESMVPFWVTVVCSDGKEYVKLSRKTKYNVVKASLKRAIASST